MNHSARAYSVLICLMSAMATSALAQQPPDPVRSDSMANTAMGSNALFNVKLSESACHNTASGEDALYSDTSGSYNTATGFSSLYSNKTGDNNTAAGYQSLYYNATGSSNTASGYEALFTNTAGSDNTALGAGALRSAKTGNNNIAVGYEAGYNLTSGINNIEIGNKGLATDYNMIKIGVEGLQAKTFIAGIYKTSVSGSAVMVNSSGQLGVVVSSERFKTDIESMGSHTAKLQALRPVEFHLKTDPHGAVQYGLIAEEVAKVYPELVIRDETGRIDGVRYDELAPMLLKELQEQQKVMAAQSANIAAQDQRAAAQDTKIARLQEQLASIQAALVKLQPTDQLVAQR
ncbi:MAG TPA: tail fiber domain-containing protein [Steroidobacteraceae bacterium]|nr:tail fiber domain-containing protein [Steroidobacteraceae bacterium]